MDCEDLPGDEGRAGEEVYRLGDVLGRADARERRRGEDARALGHLELAVVRPGDGARRDAVHANLRRELDRKRARERGKPGLGDAVPPVALQGPLGVDVDDVADRAPVFRLLPRRFLPDKQRRSKVWSNTLLPVRT